MSSRLGTPFFLYIVIMTLESFYWTDNSSSWYIDPVERPVKRLLAISRTMLPIWVDHVFPFRE